MQRLLLLLSLFLTLLYLNDLLAIAGNAARVVTGERSAEMPLIRTAGSFNSSCGDRALRADGGRQVEQWIGSICIWLGPDITPLYSAIQGTCPGSAKAGTCRDAREKKVDTRLAAVRTDVGTDTTHAYDINTSPAVADVGPGSR